MSTQPSPVDLQRAHMAHLLISSVCTPYLLSILYLPGSAAWLIRVPFLYLEEETRVRAKGLGLCPLLRCHRPLCRGCSVSRAQGEGTQGHMPLCEDRVAGADSQCGRCWAWERASRSPGLWWESGLCPSPRRVNGRCRRAPDPHPHPGPEAGPSASHGGFISGKKPCEAGVPLPPTDVHQGPEFLPVPPTGFRAGRPVAGQACSWAAPLPPPEPRAPLGREPTHHCTTGVGKPCTVKHSFTDIRSHTVCDRSRTRISGARLIRSSNTCRSQASESSACGSGRSARRDTRGQARPPP